MFSKTVLAAVAALSLAAAAPVLAQMNHDGHDMDHGHGAAMDAPKGDTGPSSKAYAEANAKMHAAMDIIFTGDSDVDFVTGMIAHHQGAIDMAKVVLDHGKDPQIRKLAEEIIAAQEGEIAFMKSWLDQRAGK